MPRKIHKRNLIVSYNNLSDELKELFKERYPDGYKDYLQKTIKPNGEFFFAVPMETEDSVYMVKFDVKIDTCIVEDDLDKDLYDDDKTEDSEFAPLSEAIDKEEGESHNVGALKHGNYEDIFENPKIDKKEFELAAADIQAEFGNDEDEDDFDNYTDDKPEDDADDDEPSDDDLLNLDDDFMDKVLNDDLSEDAQTKKNSRQTKEKSDTKPTENTKCKKRTCKTAKK